MNNVAIVGMGDVQGSSFMLMRQEMIRVRVDGLVGMEVDGTMGMRIVD